MKGVKYYFSFWQVTIQIWDSNSSVPPDSLMLLQYYQILSYRSVYNKLKSILFISLFTD